MNGVRWKCCRVFHGSTHSDWSTTPGLQVDLDFTSRLDDTCANDSRMGC